MTGVVLYNRSGPLQKRLTNFAIVLLDNQGQEVFRKAYHSEGSFVQKNEGFLINKEGIFAKAIRIELLGKKGVLSLAEVKATTSQKPLLPYKPLTFEDVKRLDLSTAQATQSSTLYEAQASRVIDGNTDAYWSGKSVNHTDVAKQQWWQVKLTKQQTLTSLTIYNRAPGKEPERLSNFAVILLNNKGKQVFKKVYHQDESYIQGRQSLVLSSKGIKAQTIKIQQLGDTERSLSLAEVEVYGIPAK